MAFEIVAQVPQIHKHVDLAVVEINRNQSQLILRVTAIGQNVGVPSIHVLCRKRYHDAIPQNTMLVSKLTNEFVMLSNLLQIESEFWADFPSEVLLRVRDV